MPRREASGDRETFQQRRERRAAIKDPEVVMNAAARFLELRSRSVQEVRRHLIQAGYREELVEQIVARLSDMGILNDDAFARMWVESRDRARPRSEQALRRELTLKGIDRELAAEVLDARRHGGFDAATAQGEDAPANPDMAAAMRLLAKRRGALLRIADDRERRGRAYGLLARNGFDPEVCREATMRFLASEAGGDADDAGESPADTEP